MQLHQDEKELFLHRLPEQLDLKQRVIFEAIAFAADFVELAMERILSLVLSALKRDGDLAFTPYEQNCLFLDAWSLVDQINNMHEIIKALPASFKTPISKNFIKHTAVVRNIRNDMEHLVQRLGNIVGKGLTNPIFGVLTFTWIPTDKIDKDNFIGNVVCTFASAVHTKSFYLDSSRCLSPNIVPPCGFFLLHAFGRTVNLGELADHARALREHLNGALEAKCRKVAEETARRTGQTTESLLKPVISGRRTLIVRAERRFT
jgi:hypothetical protein